MSSLTFRSWRADDLATVLRHAEASPDLWRQLPERDDILQRLCTHRNGEDGRWNVAICVDGDVVGNVALMTRPPRIGWCSYWIAEEARGRGLASRALLALAGAAFDDLGLYRLELAHRVNNPASGRVAENAGFQREGIMRGELEYDGIRFDTALWSRLVIDPVPASALDIEPLTLAQPSAR